VLAVAPTTLEYEHPIVPLALSLIGLRLDNGQRPERRCARDGSA
jgi:hypothetical protein